LSAREYIHCLRELTGRDFRVYPQSTTYWALLELSKWLVKWVARKPGNSRLTWRELAYRTGAARFDCSGVQQQLDWHPESDRQAFIDRGIRAALPSVE
jgi:hypothetical protein